MLGRAPSPGSHDGRHPDDTHGVSLRSNVVVQLGVVPRHAWQTETIHPQNRAISESHPRTGRIASNTSPLASSPCAPPIQTRHRHRTSRGSSTESSLHRLLRNTPPDALPPPLCAMPHLGLPAIGTSWSSRGMIRFHRMPSRRRPRYEARPARTNCCSCRHLQTLDTAHDQDGIGQTRTPDDRDRPVDRLRETWNRSFRAQC
jgi:hypothetical protein